MNFNKRLLLSCLIFSLIAPIQARFSGSKSEVSNSRRRGGSTLNDKLRMLQEAIRKNDAARVEQLLNNDLEGYDLKTLFPKKDDFSSRHNTTKSKNQDYTFFHLAVGSGNPRIVRAFLNRDPGLVKVKGRKGMIALFYLGAEGNKVGVLEELIRGGVDLQTQSSDGKNIIHFLSGRENGDDNLNLIEEVMRRGVLPILDDNEQSPLHVAMAQENIEIAKTFLDRGLDLYAKDKVGDTPLEFLLRPKVGDYYPDEEYWRGKARSQQRHLRNICSELFPDKVFCHPLNSHKVSCSNGTHYSKEGHYGTLKKLGNFLNRPIFEEGDIKCNDCQYTEEGSGIVCQNETYYNTSLDREVNQSARRPKEKTEPKQPSHNDAPKILR